MNHDEAQRALDLARAKLAAGDAAAALRLAEKSAQLHASPEAEALIQRVRRRRTAGDTSADSPKDSRGARQSKSPTRRDGGASASETPRRPFSSEHVAGIKRIRLHYSRQEYYEILGVSRDADDEAIKRAYRKLALKYHPDKCDAPGAEDAFKFVSDAFAILSDAQDRRTYDQTGRDPRSRSGGAGGPAAQFAGFQHPFANMRAGPAGGPGADAFDAMFQDVFEAMAGQGMGTYFFTRNGAYRRRHARAGAAGGPAGARGAEPNGAAYSLQLMQMLPLVLFLLVFVFASQLPALFAHTRNEPAHAFAHSSKYSVRCATVRRGVPYYINEPLFARAYPTVPLAAAAAADDPRGALRELHRGNHAFQLFDGMVETQYLQHLAVSCAQQRAEKERAERDAFWLFGLAVDQRRLDAARSRKTPACDLYQHYWATDLLSGASSG